MALTQVNPSLIQLHMPFFLKTCKLQQLVLPTTPYFRWLNFCSLFLARVFLEGKTKGARDINLLMKYDNCSLLLGSLNVIIYWMMILFLNSILDDDLGFQYYVVSSFNWGPWNEWHKC